AILPHVIDLAVELRSLSDRIEACLTGYTEFIRSSNQVDSVVGDWFTAIVTILESVPPEAFQVESPGTMRGPSPQVQSFLSGTAFIIMAMDPANPELEDIVQCYKDVCAGFGIVAERADDIEHSDLITQV